MSGRFYGALWSMPIVLGFAAMIVHDTVGYALCAMLLATALLRPWGLRWGARAAFVAAVLIRHWGIGPEPLAVLIGQQTLPVVLTLTWPLLGREASTLLFLIAAPVLVGLFEAFGASRSRLLLLAFGLALLSLQQELGGQSALYVALFGALFALWRLPRAHFRLSMAAVAVAVLAGSLTLSGASSAAAPYLLRVLQGGAVTTTGYPEDVAHLDKPLTQQSTVMFEAAAPQPVYWTVLTATDYTGQGWKVTDPSLPLKPPPAKAPPSPPDQKTVTETVTLEAALPSAVYGGTFLSVKDAPFSFDSTYGLLHVGKSKYTVAAAVPNLSQSALESIRSYPGRGQPQSSPRVQALSQQIVQGIPRWQPYRRAMAIVGYLKTHETYTLSVPNDHGQDFVDNFLFTSHTGDCNGFSSAFVLLARAAGIQARWAAGFTYGTQISPGHYLVRASDGHSWAQIYLQGPGWVSIDPTPGFALSGAAPSPSTSAAAGTGGLAAASPTKAPQLKTSGQGDGGPTPSSLALPPSALWAVALAFILVLGFLFWRRLSPAGPQLRWVFRLRLAASAAGDPWPRVQTVREWLGTPGSPLCRYLEACLYEGAPATPSKKARGEARSRLRQTGLRGYLASLML